MGIKFGNECTKIVPSLRTNATDRVFDMQLKDCVFVDVGANIGTWTIFFGSKGMETYSFEPFPKNFRLLCTGVELSRAYFNSFGTVHLHNNAVSSTTGEHVDFQNEESSSNQGHVQVQFGKGGEPFMHMQVNP